LIFKVFHDFIAGWRCSCAGYQVSSMVFPRVQRI
jgi:hypothetical protein